MHELPANYNIASQPSIAVRMPTSYEYVYRPARSEIVNVDSTVTKIEIDEESALATMIASEAILAQDWDSPEDEEAWADL